MLSIRTVNLVLQKRQRAAYPPSAFALDNAGTVALATPRPLEPRSYDFGLHHGSGGVDPKWRFSCETLLKMEVSHAGTCVGITSDDLYLFRDRSKNGFLADRHINYIDTALSANGDRFVAAFSDLAGASYALAYGDVTGRLIWLEEFDSPLTAVAISRDGTRAAAGTENGTLTLLDVARRAVWSFELDARIRSIACSERGECAAYALEGGQLGMIADDGERIWEASAAGEPDAMAMSADGGLTAVISTSSDDATSTIHCFLKDGSEGWRYDAERKLASLSLSPDGRYLAAGSRDGTLVVFGITPGDGTGSPDSAGLRLAEAQRLAESGELAAACIELKKALTGDPANMKLYDEYVRIRERWRSGDLERGDHALASGDVRTAIRLYGAMVEDEPLDTAAALKLRAARIARAMQLVVLAAGLEEAQSYQEAEQALREAVAVAPLDEPGARRKLATFLEERAAEYDAKAEKYRSEGDLQKALDSLLVPQSTLPSSARADRIRSIQVELEFAAGMEAYNSRDYLRAAFQFKKVLQLDRGHAAALRQLEFARRFVQEPSTDSLQDRFSKLE